MPGCSDTRLEGKCPRHPAATIAALTAATCGVLTGFVGFRSADLGHNPRYPRAGLSSSADSQKSK